MLNHDKSRIAGNSYEKKRTASLEAALFFICIVV